MTDFDPRQANFLRPAPLRAGTDRKPFLSSGTAVTRPPRLSLRALSAAATLLRSVIVTATVAQESAAVLGRTISLEAEILTSVWLRTWKREWTR